MKSKSAAWSGQEYTLLEGVQGGRDAATGPGSIHGQPPRTEWI